MTAALVFVAACSWANPGANPYQGAPAEAIASYTDIPADVRARLKERMQRLQYDDVAEITRDGIQGQHEYTALRDMHFGRRTVCGTPDRSMWADSMRERGLVYCEDEHCIIVPTVCRNVSRVSKVHELRFDPPGAGPTSGGGGFVPMPAPAQAEPVSFAALVQADPMPAPVVPRWAPVFAPAWNPAPPPIYLLPPLPPVPEPGPALMLAVGLLVLAWRCAR